MIVGNLSVCLYPYNTAKACIIIMVPHTDVLHIAACIAVAYNSGT